MKSRWLFGLLLWILAFPSFGFSQDQAFSLHLQKSPKPVTLLDVHFQDANQGWVVGAGGTILYTKDGGVTWLASPRRTNVLLTAVTFVNESHGWIIGQNGTIFHTSNGGKLWLPQVSGTNGTLYASTFLSAEQGWIVGARGTILTTTDGG
ncbi:MAG: YCF48-related protein, partial [Nitrospirales bacterium]